MSSSQGQGKKTRKYGRNKRRYIKRIGAGLRKVHRTCGTNKTQVLVTMYPVDTLAGLPEFWQNSHEDVMSFALFQELTLNGKILGNKYRVRS